jgi:hypothetical protein
MVDFGTSGSVGAAGPAPCASAGADTAGAAAVEAIERPADRTIAIAITTMIHEDRWIISCSYPPSGIHLCG